jgi:hypothetical protein
MIAHNLLARNSVTCLKGITSPYLTTNANDYIQATRLVIRTGN